jgi:hypothetical protein
MKRMLIYLRCRSTEPYLRFRRLVSSLAAADMSTPGTSANALALLNEIGSQFLGFIHDHLAEGGSVIQVTVDEAQGMLDLFDRKRDGLKREHGVNYEAADALLAACLALARAMQAVMHGYFSFGDPTLPIGACRGTGPSHKIGRRRR